MDALFSQPVLKALGWSLLQFFWQALAVALLFECVMVCLRKRKANIRYVAALAALFFMAGLFAFTFIQSWRDISAYESLMAEVSINETVRFHPGVETQGAPLFSGISSREIKKPAGFLSLVVSRSLTLRILNTLENWLPVIIFIWIFGVLVLSFRLFVGWLQLKRLKHRMVFKVAEHWEKTLAGLKEKLKVSRPVRLLESRLARVPTVVGWLRPVILLPASALTGLSPSQLEAILAHELAHIRRYDYLVNAFQVVIETFFYFHPVVWWVSHRIREERENCCDDLAVATCGNALNYARALADLEELRARVSRLSLAAGGGNLLSRIKRLVDPSPVSSFRSSRWMAGFLLISHVLLLGLFVQLTSYAFYLKTRREAVNNTAIDSGWTGRVVRLIVGKDSILFEGRRIGWDQLPGLLEKLPDPGHTALEFALETDDLKLTDLVKAKSRLNLITDQLGFSSLSYAGVLSKDSAALASLSRDPAALPGGNPSGVDNASVPRDLNRNNNAGRQGDPDQAGFPGNIPENNDGESEKNADEYYYVYSFSDPEGEGWEPLPIPPGTYIDDIMNPVPVYVAPAVAAQSMIGIENKDQTSVFGTWQMKASAPLKDCEPDYLYKARFYLNTDQLDADKVPMTRLRWSDLPSLSTAGFYVDKGPNAPGQNPDYYDVYFYKSPEESFLGTDQLLYFDLIDYTEEQVGSIYCDRLEVTRSGPPEDGRLVVQYDDLGDFQSWVPFTTSKLDDVRCGFDDDGLWLESPEELGEKGVHFGGWGSTFDPEGPSFQEGKLYKAVFTLCCDNDESQKHLPMIRLRLGNWAFDWIGSREIRQTPGIYAHMPSPEGREYVVYIEAPPSLAGVNGSPSDSMVLNIDLIDGDAREFGRVYIRKVVIYEYPLP